jgi:excinuclease ABC subunit C
VKFSYPPQLLLVDGGKGQLAVAEQVVDELGLAEEIPVAGLAKRFEQVFVPGRPTPVDIPRGSEALFMLQRIRDEAHRFANAFHAERRTKRMTRSALEGIPGLGETRRQRLLKEFGGVNAVKRASLERLQALRWLPNSVATSVYDRFHGAAAPLTLHGAGGETADHPPLHDEEEDHDGNGHQRRAGDHAGPVGAAGTLVEGLQPHEEGLLLRAVEGEHTSGDDAHGDERQGDREERA